MSGLCYETAGRHLRNTEHGGVLVHGTADIGEGRKAHAWVDEGPVQGVYEPESGRHYSYAEFEELFHPEVVASYTRDEVIVLPVRIGHWGPW